MIPHEAIPYTTIGFITFWIVAAITALTAGYIFLAATRTLLYNTCQRIDDYLWANADHTEGERPDGWKSIASFYNHTLICLLEYRTPIAWRWSTYKNKVNS